MLLITHNKHTDNCTYPHSHSVSSNIFKLRDACSPQSSESAGHNGTIWGKLYKSKEAMIFWRGRWRSGVVWGVHREVVAVKGGC